MLERQSNNPLLVKGGIGRTKPTTTRLPPSDFVYGKVVSQDDGDIFNRKGPKISWPKSTAQQNHLTNPVSYATKY
jgi:hypothetical protein